MKKYLILSFVIAFLGNACAQTKSDITKVNADLAVFEDGLGLKLKKNANKKAIESISNPGIKEVATAILSKKYKPTYKYASYPAILNPRTLGRDLSIGDGYSKYENVTGVYLEKGEHVVLVDGIAEGREVKLFIPNWLRKAPNPEKPTEDPNGWGLHKQEFTLKNGVNIINLDKYGSLAYIAYFSETPEKENPISVHFITGKENGYFDIAKHKDADWNAFIDNAVYPILDAKGKHIQTAYPVESLKKYAYGRGVELISNYDSLVYRQHRLMGLIKYNKVPQNRILSRVNYNYYMFRDGDGVAYMGDKVGYAMRMVVNPDVVIKGDPCWGFSHEVGHVHQTRPMFNWGGLGEVSNNLFSLYVTRSFGNKTRISEQNNYDKARKDIIEKGISYLADEDVFNRLVIFWQLQLYFEGVGQNADFYPDLFEAFRKQEAARGTSRTGDWASDRRRGERNPAVHQLNFVRTACEVAKVDLTDFFSKYGFFYVGTLEYDDYGKYTYKMTQEMVDKCLADIKALNLPKPKIDITTLRD
ncbi:M60 family metallopeptidase [Sphingobacterium bovisgrunnientis]|uniref:M60 family metallopeptidase n=1 Tax=Sphingobacterium bovisgrunnientis TaxID=1874697 RepID=UPI00135A3567|nr:M60 family metallopeptidase [Sphingobacterium bovisgrunnientis]